MAAGLARGGDLEGALEHELQLLQDESLSGTLLPVGETLKVQVSQIVAPELADLFSKADPDQRSRLVKKIEDWSARVAEEDKPDDKRSLYELVTAAFRLTTHHDAKHAILQSACQVIDDFVLADKAEREKPQAEPSR